MKTSISAIFAYRLSGFHHPHTARYFGAEGNCRTPKKKHGKAKLYFSLIPREEAQASALRQMTQRWFQGSEILEIYLFHYRNSGRCSALTATIVAVDLPVIKYHHIRT
jgi:hypothetical protein